MGLEIGEYITDLVPSNPLGTDPKSQGDDHIRLTKKTLQQSFPNINGAVTLIPAQLNDVLVKFEGGTLPNNVHLYFGDNDMLDIYSSGISALIENKIDTALISLQSTDSGGQLKKGIDIGGAIPSVKQYFNGILVAETDLGGANFANFSSVGATNGFRTSNGVQSSSREGVDIRAHLIFYNPNGLVGRIETENLDVVIRAEGAGAVRLTTAGTDEAEAIPGAFNVINQLQVAGNNQPTDFTRTGDRLDITGVRVV